MTIAVDLGRKATKQTNKQTVVLVFSCLFQSVTFHFDCIIATVKTEVHFFLQSSPKPDHNAQYTDTVLEIGGKLIHSPRNSVALM